MAGIFRILTPHRHGRFEGEKNKEPVDYGQGDLIQLSNEELAVGVREGKPVWTKDNLELVKGDWLPADYFHDDNSPLPPPAPTPSKFELLLANRAEIVLGELESTAYNEAEAKEIIRLEANGRKRESIISFLEEELGIGEFAPKSPAIKKAPAKKVAAKP